MDYSAAAAALLGVPQVRKKILKKQILLAYYFYTRHKESQMSFNMIKASKMRFYKVLFLVLSVHRYISIRFSPVFTWQLFPTAAIDDPLDCAPVDEVPAVGEWVECGVADEQDLAELLQDLGPHGPVVDGSTLLPVVAHLIHSQDYLL